MARRRLRVLQVGKFYPPHRGGMESHLATLCEGLAAHVDLEVLVAGETGDTVREVVGGVPVTRLGVAAHLAGTPLCPAMLRSIAASRADIIHVHLPNPAAVLAVLAARTPARLLATYHSDVLRQRVLHACFEPALHLFLSRCTAVIATSPDYIEHSPILSRHRDRCRAVPLGIDLALYEAAQPDAVRRIRQLYGERVVMAAGRLIYYKGFGHLIEAMASVNGRLLLVGEGPLGAELRAQAENPGSSGKVAFLGNVSNEELVACYHASDVFVLPSIARTEAFGIVQIEAMAAGLPVINTRLDSGVPFVSVHETTGLTVPPANAPALSEAITRLLDDRGLRCRFGRAARDRAVSLFTAEAMRQRTLEVYNSVVPHAIH